MDRSMVAETQLLTKATKCSTWSTRASAASAGWLRRYLKESRRRVSRRDDFRSFQPSAAGKGSLCKYFLCPKSGESLNGR